MARKKKVKINHEQLEAELMNAVKELAARHDISAGVTMLWCKDGVIKILMHQGGEEIGKDDARSIMYQFAVMAMMTANSDDPKGEQFQV